MSLTLRERFISPPDSTKPWVYCYWISNNICKRGITKDLECMAALGIAEACLGNVDPNTESRGDVDVLSESWWEAVDHAIAEGGRLGVAVSLFNSPGWSQSGGPWVPLSESMKYLDVLETGGVAGGPLDLRLPEPEGYFEQVAVLAVRGAAEVPAGMEVFSEPEVPGIETLGRQGDGECLELREAAPGEGVILSFRFKEAIKPRAILIFPGDFPFLASGNLERRTEDGTWVEERTLRLDRSNPSLSVGPMPLGPMCFSLPGSPASAYRLRLWPEPNLDERRAAPRRGSAVSLRRVVFLQEARLEQFVEKQMGKMCQEPVVSWETWHWKSQPEPGQDEGIIHPGGIVDVSDSMDATSRLQCTLDEGSWRILRVVARPTGTTNAPAAPEATGPEVDKMSAKAIRNHFHAFLGTAIARTPEHLRKTMRHVIADSFEAGPQNWTDGFEQLFEDRYGYSLRPWLPVFAGYIVSSVRDSERFLWDVRRLVADRIATGYTGALREVAREHGMRLWLENFGHWSFPAEFLQYGGQTDDISGEFWTLDPLEADFWKAETLGEIEVRAASSAAHLYGKPVVSAEAFTSAGSPFVRDPWALKTRGDWSFAHGVNHFVLHVSIHQPDTGRLPGVNAQFGTEFNRKNLWFPHARCWFDYFRRCHALLQAGQPVADVAYFIGEDAPGMSAIRAPELPPGYQYDYINGEMIHRLRVENGRIVAPSGVSWKLLVLPPQDTMRPELLEKIGQLVQDGAAVLGPRPACSPSMEGQPEADLRVERLAASLWPEEGSSVRRENGWIFQNLSIDEVMERLELPEDLANGCPVLWAHRRSEDGAEIYFVSNPADEALEIAPVFRAAEGDPSVWHPVDGSIRKLPRFSRTGGRIQVPLRLEPREAYFVVFEKAPAGPTPGKEENFPGWKVVQRIDSPWSASFDPALKGPAEPIEFLRLMDLLDHPDPRIQTYSGTVVYQTHFDLASPPADGLFLEIEDFASIASVELNGTPLGSCWTRPGRLSVRGALQSGRNDLTICVVTTWNNRLVAESALPPEKRWCAMDVWRVTPGAATTSCGLIGPVALVEAT